MGFDALLALRDSEGRSAVTVINDGLHQVVEVDVSDAELAYACARCGIWESIYGPRFQRCVGCKSRYYQCSTEVRTVAPLILPLVF